jgi:hypothetical protein
VPVLSDCAVLAAAVEQTIFSLCTRRNERADFARGF